MIKKKNKKDAVAKKHRRVRVKISGTTERPRLAVHKSNKHIYAQVIDDTKGVTLASAGTLETDFKSKYQNCGNIEAAKDVGRLIAERSKNAGIEEIVFDRGGFIYHGRIAAVADAAREGGLVF